MEKSSLLRVPEGRATYLNMGALLSMADDDNDGDGKMAAGGGVDEDEAAAAAVAATSPYNPSLEPFCSWI